MANYKGPHVAVYQKFDTSAPGVAVEDVPSVAIATSYEVYENEVIGTHKGVMSNSYLWGADKPIFDKTVIGKDLYNFYPVKMYASTIFGDSELDSDEFTKTSDNVTVIQDATYTVPDTERKIGVSTASIPFYKQQNTVVTIKSDSSKTISIENGALKSAGLVTGQRVYLIKGSSFIYAGSLEYSPNVETVINVSQSNVAGTYDGIMVGVEYNANNSLESVAEGNIGKLKTDGTIDDNGIVEKTGNKIVINGVDYGTYTVASGTITVQNHPTTEVDNVTTIVSQTPAGVPEQIASISAGASATGVITFTDATIDLSKVNPGESVNVSGFKSDGESVSFSGNVDSVDVSSKTITVTALTDDIAFITSISVSDAPISTGNTLFDKTGTFISSRVRVGDILEFSTRSKKKLKASITNIVSSNTLFFNTIEESDTKYSKYKKVQLNSLGTDDVIEYKIGRLVGFSTYNDSVGTAAGTAAEFFVSIDTPSKKVSKGDLVSFGAKTAGYTNEVTSVVPHPTVAGGIIVNLANELPADVTTAMISWTPIIENEIKATFRAVNKTENLNVVRITSINAIEDYYGPVSPYNELAFMLNNMYINSGFRVVYGVNVDATDENEYTEALENLKNIDVYSHALGTTSPGINSVLPAYVDELSGPYNGSERIAVRAWDEKDLTIIAEGDAIVSGSTITMNTVDFLDEAVAVRKGDVFVFDTSTYTAIESPVLPNVVNITLTSGEAVTSGFCKVYKGIASDIADKISTSLGESNRRITDVFPGWFKASYQGITKFFPPYFITSSIAAADSQELASQSFTNMDMTVVGLSNYQLNTSTRFSKSDLDTIAGDGVDLMIQDSAITQSFKSRHDLTTNMDAIEFRERSITRQVDVVAKTMRQAVTPYVGKYNITGSLMTFIKQVVVNTARQLVSTSVTQKVDVVSVARDKQIKDKVNIILNVTVFVAGNYYDITLNVKS